VKNSPVSLMVACTFGALLLSACSSTTTVETKVPDRPFASDARKRASVHTELGSAYFQERKLAIALEEANMAIKDDPTFAPGHTLRGLVYMEIKNVEQARESFNRALAINADDSELLNTLGWFECQLGDVSKSLEYFGRVKRDALYATPYKPLMNEGLCLRKLNREDEARTSLMNALRIRADLPDAHFALALSYFAANNMKEAERFNNNAIQLGATAGTLLLASRIAKAFGDRASEQGYINQLVQRFPGSSEAKAVSP
jgi:type IV pilus assembly protein PilF